MGKIEDAGRFENHNKAHGGQAIEEPYAYTVYEELKKKIHIVFLNLS
jgi:hypothetical protein